MAGFFAFQRRFLCDGESGTAADDEQSFARFECFDCRRPVGVRGLFEFVRQGLERVLQFAVAVPVGEQVQAEGDGGDEAFGRGDAFFRPGLYGQHVLAGFDDGRRHDVHQRRGAGAACRQRFQHGDDVRRAAGLGGAEGEVVLHLPRGL